MNAVETMAQTAFASPQHDLVEAQRRLWNTRFEKEGLIWGEEPSITAITLLERIKRTSASIVEIGSAYGRDMHEVCVSGHSVMGIDVSIEAHRLADRHNGPLKPYVANGRATFFTGSFTEAPRETGSKDAVLSHRVLHLLGNNGLVRAFERYAARILVAPGGLLAVSARSFKDFDEDQMTRRADGFAEYKPHIPNREGQLISFWDEARYRQVFGNKFDIIDYFEAEEAEAALNNGKTAKLAVMVAVRKPL